MGDRLDSQEEVRECVDDAIRKRGRWGVEDTGIVRLDEMLQY